MQRFLVVLLALGFVVIGSLAHAGDLTQDKIDELERIVSPVIKGDTLYIEGRIGSHIYDYLAYEAQALKAVKVVELNSLGGDVEWGLEIAKKLQALKIDTRLSADKFCASACTFLYAAGVHRYAARGTWLGIHGARLGAGYTTTFQGLCFIDLEGGKSEYFPKKAGCQAFVDHWYDLSLTATNNFFSFMEANGVLPSLRQTYFGMPDDPEWTDDMNVIRKPNWPLNSEDAVQYNLVTDLI